MGKALANEYQTGLLDLCGNDLPCSAIFDLKYFSGMRNGAFPGKIYAICTGHGLGLGKKPLIGTI